MVHKQLVWLNLYKKTKNGTHHLEVHHCPTMYKKSSPGHMCQALFGGDELLVAW
jgi:hypothetical protein